MSRRVARLAPTLLGLTLVANAASACEGLRVERAWLRLPPPGADVAAAYFEAINDGKAPLTITGVASPGFGGGMLHAMALVDGQMRMRPQGDVVLAPGMRFSAAPGGSHVMLWEAASPVIADGDYRLTLTCAEGAPLTVPLPVRREAPPAP
ncbi:MAG: copper chaperone PCu(A)C [Gammaproteobacteria bacterium]|nr:copper chaperone PCu(A)C [Gammaproteobacteria bacterium]